MSLFSVGAKEDFGGDDVVSSVLVVSWLPLEETLAYPSGFLKDSAHLLLGLDVSLILGESKLAHLSGIVSLGRLKRSAVFVPSTPSTYVEHVDTCIVSFGLKDKDLRAYQHPKRRASAP